MTHIRANNLDFISLAKVSTMLPILEMKSVWSCLLLVSALLSASMWLGTDLCWLLLKTEED